MKIKFFLTIIVICFLLSCKKSDQQISSITGTEAEYKAKLEALVSLKTIDPSRGSAAKTTNSFTFTAKSYEELYNALKFVEDGKVYSTSDSIQTSKYAPSAMSTNGLITYDSPIYTFTYTVTDAADVTGTLISTIADSYTVTFSCGYTQNAGGTYSPQGVANQATTPIMVYGGFASATGHATMSTGVYDGHFAGVLSGQGTIGGIPTSIAITFQGGYTVIPASTPGGTAYINHNLSANSSTSPGTGGGGGTTPPP